MTKFEHKFDNFKKAAKRLNEANTRYKSNTEDDALQDSLIQRFEFTFELSWKSLREYMIEQGYYLDSISPKGVLAAAYQEGIIDNEQVWLQMLDDRNATTHDYGGDFSADIADRISNIYCKELTVLNKKLAQN